MSVEMTLLAENLVTLWTSGRLVDLNIEVDLKYVLINKLLLCTCSMCLLRVHFLLKMLAQ